MEKIRWTDRVRNEVHRIKEERNVVKLHECVFFSSTWIFYSSFIPLTDCNDASDGPRSVESGIEPHQGVGVVHLIEPIWPFGDRKLRRVIRGEVWCCEIFGYCDTGGRSDIAFQDFSKIQLIGDRSAVTVCKTEQSQVSMIFFYSIST